MLTLFVNVFLKIFMIFTPFFVISAFLSLTRDESPAERQRIAIKITLAVGLTCFVLFLFGSYIFALFGITLDAFRIGAGAVLFISAVTLTKEKRPLPPKTPGKMLPWCPWRFRSLSGQGLSARCWSWAPDSRVRPRKSPPAWPCCAPSWPLVAC